MVLDNSFGGTRDAQKAITEVADEYYDINKFTNVLSCVLVIAFTCLQYGLTKI